MTNYAAPVQIASVQTLARRIALPPVDLVIVDEAHIYSKAIASWMDRDPKLIFVGLSATPWAKGMGRRYDDLIVCATIQELIDAGHLSPFRCYAPAEPDLSGVRTNKGDFVTADLSATMSEGGLVADVVSTWLEKGEARPTLCFAVDRAHAQSLQARFVAAGVACGYVDAYTDKVERALTRKRFEAGELRVVCNVGCLTTGVDWAVGCIILARPTRSEMLYVQMVGRGLRVNPGLDDCIILDHAGNALRLGLVTDIHHTSLEFGRQEGGRGSAAQRAAAEEVSAVQLREAGEGAALPAVRLRGAAGLGRAVDRGRARRDHWPQADVHDRGEAGLLLRSAGDRAGEWAESRDGRRTSTATSSTCGRTNWSARCASPPPRFGRGLNPATSASPRRGAPGMRHEGVKSLARGQWRGILLSFGFPEAGLQARHGPCPFCGGKDRYRWDNKDGNGSYFCSQCGAGSGIDLLMKFKGWDYRTAAREVERLLGAQPLQPEVAKPASTAAENQSRVQELLERCRPIEPGDFVDRYFQARGIGFADYPDSLLACDSCWVRPGLWLPALVARIVDVDGNTVSLQRTWLGDGRKADIKPPRKLMPGSLPAGSMCPSFGCSKGAVPGRGGRDRAVGREAHGHVLLGKLSPLR